MTPRLSEERLAELAMGEPPTAVEAALLASDPALAHTLSELVEAFGIVGLALPAAPPPSTLRDRLLADTADPWWRALDVFAQYCDLSVERLKAYVAEARAGTWHFWPEAGVELFHLEGGPAVAGADVGFVRAPPNHHFPDHTHFGGERAVILQGSMRLGDVTIVTGQMDVRNVGDVHDWYAGPEGVVFAVVVYEGVALLPK